MVIEIENTVFWHIKTKMETGWWSEIFHGSTNLWSQSCTYSTKILAIYLMIWLECFCSVCFLEPWEDWRSQDPRSVKSWIVHDFVFTVLRDLGIYEQTRTWDRALAAYCNKGIIEVGGLMHILSKTFFVLFWIIII